MNIESIQSEFEASMGLVLDNLKQEKVGERYLLFKDQLKKTIFNIIDKHNLDLHNPDKSQAFLDQLRPIIEANLERLYTL
ncbi:MAG: hypothetical protein RLZZ318_622 [Bacteroidota bacterium]|jgi:hypothetical protein